MDGRLLAERIARSPSQHSSSQSVARRGIRPACSCELSGFHRCSKGASVRSGLQLVYGQFAIAKLMLDEAYSYGFSKLLIM